MKKNRCIACLLLVFSMLCFFNMTVYAIDSQLATLELSSDELQYLQDKKTLRVSIVSDWKPFSHTEKDGTYQGLPVMVLERLSEVSGVALEFIPAQSYNESLEHLLSGQVDLMGMLMRYPTESQDATGTKVLEIGPYLESQTMLIHHKNSELASVPIKLLTDVTARTGYTHNPNITTVYYDSQENCLNAVQSRQADVAVCDVFTGSLLMQQYKARDLVSLPTSIVMNFGFGVLPQVDSQLISVLQKTIHSFPRKEFNDALIAGGALQRIGFFELIYHYPFEIICFGISMMFVIMLSLFTYTKVRTNQRHSLQGYEESYRLLSDTFGEAGMEYDYINDCLTVFGKQSNLDIAKKVDDFKAKLQDNAIRLALTPEQFEHILSDGAEGKSFSAEFQVGVKSGGWIWYRLIYTVICTSESHRRPIRLVGCLANIDAEHQEKEKLLLLSSNDQLTGLYNRAAAENRICERLRENIDACTGMMVMLDIDNFKKFNDQMGHLCGDDVLRSVGRIVQENFSSSDILCRWGGDEFMFFLVDEDANAERMTARIDLLREKMCVYEYQGVRYPVTLSAGGVKSYPNCTVESLFEEADKALYLAKRNGRNQLCLSAPTENTANEQAGEVK